MTAPLLLKWHGPMTDPGNQGTQTLDSEEQWLTFRAEFNKPAQIHDAYNLPQCPTFFSFLNFGGRYNNRLFVVAREGRQLPEAPQVIEVRVKYSNRWGNEQEFDGKKFQFIPNPLERPALIEWGSYAAREAVEYAYDQNTNKQNVPVATTAGEPLILEEEFHRRKLVIRKNVAAIANDLFAESGDFINEEDTVIGGHKFKKLTLWLWPIEIGAVQIENNVLYYPITMTILHNPNTWIRRIRNAGYYMKAWVPKFKIGANGQIEKYWPLEPIVFSDGRKADRPILLDQDGRPLQAVKVGVVDQRLPDGTVVQFPKFDVQSPDDFGRAFTDEELEKSVRYFRTRRLLNFTQNLPLR